MITETTTNLEKPDIRAKKAWRVTRLISFVVFLLLALGASIGTTLWSSEMMDSGYLPTLVYIVSALVVLWRLLALIIYPAIEYRQWFYSISEDRVEIRHGIFFIKNSIIPIIRIQHVTVEQGPIYRRFGLHNVVISLASGNFQILGLSRDKAEEISKNLNHRLYVRLESEDKI
ncbi:MAG: PH domain-containing protein [Anaerovoracaceae bacterium]|jgi:membrane protein YdbS with pleckstrin-like domain